jgi:hypothetical protein
VISVSVVTLVHGSLQRAVIVIDATLDVPTSVLFASPEYDMSAGKASRLAADANMVVRQRELVPERRKGRSGPLPNAFLAPHGWLTGGIQPASGVKRLM